MYKLEALRQKAGGRAITISSGFRGIAHNQSVGGASYGMHLYGVAADAYVSGLSTRQVYVLAVGRAPARRQPGRVPVRLAELVVGERHDQLSPAVVPRTWLRGKVGSGVTTARGTADTASCGGLTLRTARGPDQGLDPVSKVCRPVGHRTYREWVSALPVDRPRARA